MGAVRIKTLADLRRRRLQSAVIVVVLLLASTAATLALGILVESNAPFERAFASANGAHLVIEYEGAVDAARLAATRGASVVTASAGPWPVTDGAVGHPKGGLIVGRFSGRPRPEPTIDNVTISAGRWWQAPGEIVLDQPTARLLDKTIGDEVQVHPPAIDKSSVGLGAAPGRTFTVVGIAGSVSTPDLAAWMSPDDIAALSPGHPPTQQMLYRVSPAATEADLVAATASITESLPVDAVVDSRSYLEVKAGVDRLADLYVPILLAFSIFALLAAAFTIANVVSGVVLTSYRDIGVMKAIGYTPTQVTTILLAQILLPVAIGATAGVVIGTVASRPIVEGTAESFGLPAAFSVSLPVIGAVLAIALLTAFIAAVGPAVHAGRLSAVGAMTRGTAPSTRAGGGRLRRLGLRLPVGLPMRIGVAAGVAHPVRASMTLGALVVGVAALTFAIGLNWSLLRVMEDLGRSVASPVRLELAGSSVRIGLEGPSARSDEVTAAIAGDPSTARSVSIGEGQVAVPGIGAVQFVGYEGDSTWLGYASIRGRWFLSPGEAVAPTNFFTQTGLEIGDTTTVSHDGRTVTVRLVGEILDIGDNEASNLLLRGTWADLATLYPSVEPSRWEARPLDGIDAHAYRNHLGDVIGGGVHVFVQEDSSSDESFLLFLTVIGVMGAVLIVISLGGVFNTVLLETRQRTREIAVLKAIGLTPTQVVGMVLASILPVAIAAGLIGVPLGLVAQRAVLDYMGEVAARTDIPPAVVDVFPPLMFVALGLSGLAIGAVGAYLPARRAARARIAPVLQAE